MAVSQDPHIIRLAEPEWDIASCDLLYRILAPALTQPDVIIDMSAVTYLDSSCLSKLIKLYVERVTKNGFPPSRMVITSPHIMRLFKITELDRLWSIHPTVAEALTATDAKPSPVDELTS
jgi:anti-anti-sigma factor